MAKSICQGPTDMIRGGGGLLGCSSSTDACSTGIEGEGGIATYRLVGSGMALAHLQETLPGVPNATAGLSIVMDGEKDDAFVSTEGGQAEVFPTGALSAMCFFTVAPTSEIERNGIQIVTAADPNVPGDCADPQRCIQCTTTEGVICTISCAGTLPRDEFVDVDGFDLTITFLHRFLDPDPAPPHMLRFDGFADKWTEFLPEGEIPDFITTEGCNGGAPDEMVLNNNDFLNINDLVPESTWVQAYGVDDTSLGGNCMISTLLYARMSFAGILQEGALSAKRGPIVLNGTLCDDSSSDAACPAPAR